MAKFTDANGLDWHVKITALTVDNFEGETGLSFFGEAAAGKLPMRTAWRLCYHAVKAEAQKRAMPTYEIWLDGLGKKGIVPMTNAVMSEVVEFFPEPQKNEALSGSDPQTDAPGNGETSSDLPEKPG